MHTGLELRVSHRCSYSKVTILLPLFGNPPVQTKIWPLASAQVYLIQFRV